MYFLRFFFLFWAIGCLKQDDKIQGKARYPGRVIAFLLSFFSGEKRKEAKKKRHFWQTAPQPKEALLRVLLACVILFVCAGVAVPFTLFLRSVAVSFFSARVFSPLSSLCFCFFFLSVGACTASVSLFSLFLRTVSPHCFFALLFILLQTTTLLLSKFRYEYLSTTFSL